MSAPTALLLSGTGRYADQWHPFAATSEALAGLLGEAGFDVVTAADVDAALEWLTSPWNWPDLLAVNIGNPLDPAPSPGPAAASGLRAWLACDRPLLGLHSSSTAFTDLPEWKPALGGHWVPGTSMHPEYGTAKVLISDGSGPLSTDPSGRTDLSGGAGLVDFEVMDERYSWLDTDPAVTVHARHLHDAVLHPLVWSHQRAGGGRTFYDALGHDAASFDSPGHRQLLRRGIDWLSASISAKPAAIG